MTLSGWPLWWRLIVIGGLWGSSFPLLRMVAVEMSPFALAAMRGGFAALAVLGFLAATGQLRGGRFRCGMRWCSAPPMVGCRTC
jgi:drug/metabolite transporter (DMT)-like permease